MWKSILAAAIKALCYIGWHMWEYVYNTKGGVTSMHRQCKRCGIQRH